jgi:hypothetical protein
VIMIMFMNRVSGNKGGQPFVCSTRSYGPSDNRDVHLSYAAPGHLVFMPSGRDTGTSFRHPEMGRLVNFVNYHHVNHYFMVITLTMSLPRALHDRDVEPGLGGAREAVG